MSRRQHLDEGESLIEVMITIIVLGIALTAVLSGFATSIGISFIHKTQATEQTIARDFGEYLQYSSAYHNCGSPADYGTDVTNFGTSYQLPDTSTPLASGEYTVTIDSVAYWDGSATNPSFSSTCSTDNGVQRFAFTITNANESRAAVTLEVVKRK